MGAPSLWIWLLVCTGLSAVSLLSEHSLTYDAWSWLMWGREILHLDLHTGGGTAWKPLPSFLDALFAMTGSSLAPALWLLTARSVSLLALVALFRVGYRLAGVFAGLIGAALFLFAAHAGSLFGFASFFALGWSDLFTVAFVLLALDRHLAGRPTPALWLLTAAGLVRPEVWPFILVYSVVVWHRSLVSRRIVALALLSIPVLWVVPDYLGSGTAFRASSTAMGAVPAAIANASHPGLTVVSYLRTLLVLPAKVGLAALAVTLLRYRERTIGWIVVLAVSWTFLVASMAEVGYPGLERFLATPIALFCLLGGIGLGGLISALPTKTVRMLAVLIAGVSVGAFAIPPAKTLLAQLRLSRRVVRVENQLPAAVSKAGGASALARCPVVTTDPLNVPLLSWTLNRRDVTYRTRPATLIFSAARSKAGRKLRREAHRLHFQLLAGTAAWQVLSRCAQLPP